MTLKQKVKAINREIKERNVKDFISEFLDESNTYGFVVYCTEKNRLSYSKVVKWGKTRDDYIYNIETFWMENKKVS